MSDAFSLLRKCMAHGLKPTVADGIITFPGGESFPLNTPTSLSLGGKTYDIGTIHFFWEHMGMPLADYIKKAMNAGMSFVSTAHRRELEKLLQSSAQVSNEGDRPAKKRKLEGAEARVSEWKAASERLLATRKTVLQSSKKSFGSVLSAVNEALSSKATVVTKKKEGASGPRFTGNPIILVPAGHTALVTMINAKEFLEDGLYVSVADKRSANARKPQSLEITRKMRDQQITFQITDNINSLRSEDWNRVVAVLVQGPDWQFRDWPQHLKDVVKIFAHMKGFHLKYHDQLIPPTVKSWNVKVLDVHRTKRHMDRMAQNALWEGLEEWLSILKIIN